MRRVAALVALAILAVPACARSVAADQTVRSAVGTIIEPGELGTEHLRVGDCIRDPIPAEVEGLYGVPCARDHVAQVFAIGDDTQVCFDALEREFADLATRTDLPRADVSALVVTDGAERTVCIIEFAEPIAEDVIRATA